MLYKKIFYLIIYSLNLALCLHLAISSFLLFSKIFDLVPQNLSIVGAIYVLKKRSTFCFFLSQKFY